MVLKIMAFLSAMVVLASCGETVSRSQDARILAMGDSMLAWHATSHQSVSHALEKQLGEEVIDRSVVGARVLYELPISGALGLNIAKQYRPGNWDWIIVNGGGNDLWLGCGCFRCDRKMNRLALEDGSDGEIPRMIARLRMSGAKVIYVGYLRSPGVGSLIEHCRTEGNELERRIARYADTDEGVHFVSLAELVPHGDRSFHSADMIHPSIKGSATIGAYIARIIGGPTRP
ncbi:MAG: SGNH/GDSL hydrolase family protein [Sedimentitalea sp.]